MASNLTQVIAVTGLGGRFPGSATIEAFGAGSGAAPAAAPDPAAGTARQRFLGCAGEAIRRAGCAARSETERTGLFAGVREPATPAVPGDELAGELARELALRGPA